MHHAKPVSVIDVGQIDARIETRRSNAIRLCADASRVVSRLDVLFGVTYEKLERYRED